MANSSIISGKVFLHFCLISCLIMGIFGCNNKNVNKTFIRGKMKIQLVVCGSFMENCYVAGDENEVIVIDPGDDADKIIKAIGSRKVKYILNTHAHVDHIGAVTELRKKYGSPFGIHKLEKPLLSDPQKNLSAYTTGPMTIADADIYFNDGDEIDFLGGKIKVLHTPGHTPGGCCFLFEKVLFTGDTLFNMSIGRTDFPGGSYENLLKSIKEKLFTLSDDTEIFPGHMDKSTIGHEKRNNPFLR